MDFPEIYNAREYVLWHHFKRPKDEDLPYKLDTLCEELTNAAVDDLKLLDEMFVYFFDYLKNEYKAIRNENVEYQAAAHVDYKRTDSIINKLWRIYKNKGKFIPLENIRTEITDLIRTEIVGDTLTSCRFLAERFEIENIHDKKLTIKCEERVDNIAFEPQMKMASGYFAYHILIRFSDHIIIEVQVFSSMVKKWRDLSRNLYKILRISPTDLDFGSKESRLISLGHLFHLAECENRKTTRRIQHAKPETTLNQLEILCARPFKIQGDKP